MDNLNNFVGPVLTANEISKAVIQALEQTNQEILVQDHGAYFRILVPEQCILNKAVVEKILGRPFLLPTELELIMCSYKGNFSLTDDQAMWSKFVA